MLRNRKPVLRVVGAQNPQNLAVADEALPEEGPNGRASGAELRGSDAVFPPVLTVYEVARLLRMNVDSVRRIDRSVLPYMHGGAGKWALYVLEDVMAYVRRCSRLQSPNKNSHGGPDQLDLIADSVRGRFRNGERHE